MKRGTIVLTPFPFTDLSGQKVRPAVVVSRSDRQGRDVLLAFITGQQPSALASTDLFIVDSHPDFPQTGLKKSSVVKLDKLVTIEISILLGELGRIISGVATRDGRKAAICIRILIQFAFVRDEA
ncbi:MAG: type II toxin-antitoxin system PemK/MazF family toxin [Candidatus Binatia bacterium]